MRNGVPWTDFNIPPPRGNPKNPGRMQRLSFVPSATAPPTTMCTMPSQNSHSADAACPYEPTRSYQSERGVAQGQTCGLTNAFTDQGTTGPDREDFTDADAFSETSFNSLDVDVSNVSVEDDQGGSWWLTDAVQRDFVGLVAFVGHFFPFHIHVSCLFFSFENEDQSDAERSSSIYKQSQINYSL